MVHARAYPPPLSRTPRSITVKGKQVGNAEAVAKLKDTATQRAADLRAIVDGHQALGHHERTRDCRGVTRAWHQGSSGQHVASYGRLPAAEPALAIGANTGAHRLPSAGARDTARFDLGTIHGPPTVLKSK
jgi:hypothetical protein